MNQNLAGRVWYSPAKPTLVNLPRGTKVLNQKDARSLIEKKEDKQ